MPGPFCPYQAGKSPSVRVDRRRVPHSPHDPRHTAASLAVSAGANVKAVQKMLGRTSAAMTLDIYADPFDDDLAAVATALHDAHARENVGTGQPADRQLTPAGMPDDHAA